MVILYEVHDNLYVNMTNKCPCACTFCLRQTRDEMNHSGSLWLEREPSVEEVKNEFIYRGAYLLNENQKQKLIDLPLIDPKRGTAHPDVVGQKPHRIAELSGFGADVPEDAKILLVETQNMANPVNVCIAIIMKSPK